MGKKITCKALLIWLDGHKKYWSITMELRLHVPADPEGVRVKNARNAQNRDGGVANSC